MAKAKAFTATIANGQTTSDVINLSSCVLVGVYLPAVFTGVALTFLACNTAGGTFVSVRDGAGAAISKVVAQAQYITLDQNQFRGINFLKIVSGSAEGGERLVVLMADPI